jgi:hypothetical protein
MIKWMSTCGCGLEALFPRIHQQDHNSLAIAGTFWSCGSWIKRNKSAEMIFRCEWVMSNFFFFFEVSRKFLHSSRSRGRAIFDRLYKHVPENCINPDVSTLDQQIGWQRRNICAFFDIHIHLSFQSPSAKPCASLQHHDGIKNNSSHSYS